MTSALLDTRPEALTITAANTALVINDMQNAFCSPGGYLERIGFDITGAAAVVEKVGRVLAAARSVGITVFHAQNGFHPDYRDAPATSPIWLKSNALRHMRAHPELTGKLLTRGGWDYDLVDGLRPIAGEFVLQKSRASCFAGTDLEQQLHARGIRNLIVVGIAINVGVEWTLREAASREFFGILIEDATMAAGGPDIHRASVFNIETFVGWVTDTAGFEASCTQLGGT